MKNKDFLITLVIVILVITFHFLKWPFLNGKFFLPFRNFFSFFDEKIKNFSDLFLSKKYLLEENKRLSNELTKLIVENIKLKMLEEENERLREELNFIKKENYKLILANIIGKKEENGLKWFILDRGIKDGVKEGFVAVSKGIVIGKIMRTTENFSFLSTLLDEKVSLAVLIVHPHSEIDEKNKIEGIVRGKKNLVTEIDLVPIDKEIKDGDLVLTSGLEYNVPKGLFVGTLKDVKKNLSDIFSQAIVELPIKIEELKMVSIIIPKIEE